MPSAPQTTPLPPPVFIPQSTPIDTASPTVPKTMDKRKDEDKFPLPKLRLEIRDIMHPGAKTFLKYVVPATALEFAVTATLELLYHSPKSKNTKVPGTRSVTVIIRSMDGVAYTTGTELDDDHKEIHFSAEYINSDGSKGRKADEILGVLTHEMVHCFQYNAKGTCPGGLIEGIADWVRLNSGLSPPHWKKEWTDKKWDAGYQTTAYFLAYIEERYGEGTVRRLNEKLRTTKYEEKRFWTELVGIPVEQLWKNYCDAMDKEAKRGSSESDIVIVEKTESIVGGEEAPSVTVAEKNPTSTSKTQPTHDSESLSVRVKEKAVPFQPTLM